MQPNSMLASELGPHKITVNAYAPGAIETAMRESLHRSDHSLFIRNTVEHMDRSYAKSTDGQPGDYQRVASAARPIVTKPS